MASEQRVSRKKQSRNIPSEERCLPLLYRHQDCIPNPKILHNCEKLNSLCCNSNQDIECHGKLVNQKTANTLKNKSKTLETNVKNESKTDNTKLDPKLNQTKPNGAVGNNEELSKSRRRRLRKRRLLISLAPTLNSTKPSPLVENVPQPIPVTRPLTRPSTSLPLSSSPNSKTSEANKPSIKESRKRIDKSVGSRIKNLKNKTLSDSTNQSKADIIKCLEEKKRSSLLQSLTNLTNSSPKKEKTSIPLVSFPDKRLTSPESNISNDGVFYFGETKHQLEKLTSITSYPDHESSNIKPISQLKQRSSPKSAGNLASDSASGFRFVLKSPTLNKTIPNSLPKPSPELKRNLFGFDSIALASKAENSRLSPAKLSTYQTKDHEFKTPILKDLSKFAIQQVLNLNSGDIVPPTNITSVPNIYENNILKNSTLKTSTPSNSPGVSIADVHQARPLIKNNFMSDLQQETTCTMKPSDVPNKPTKSREEVLLEREAKKAAKLAAKMKHQNSQALKSDGPKNDHSNLLAAVDLKDQNKKQNEENIVALNREQPSEGIISDVKSTDKNESSAKVQCKEIEVKSDRSHLPKNGVNDSTIKSKAELKAERRAKQEAQRAAKASSKATATNQKEKKTPEIKKEHIKPETDLVKVKKTVEVSKTTGQPKHKLFSHLYQEKSQLSSDQKLKVSGLHPAIVRLGIQYSSKVVVGSNARCVALLHALKQVVSDYTTPTEKEFKRGLEEELGPVKVYLNQCRPLAVSMTNALRHIKRTLTQLPNNITDIEARRKICDIIDTYITEQIDVAGKQICNTVKEKISNGDVILTYGCSSLVYKILVESHLSGIKFRVVVVDALPWREGREMLRRLVDKGLSCTYVLITAASFIMQEASKVLLGAHALLANGYVMSRAGSSQVALLAHCYNVPVLVCCETHKFCERVQTDAFVYNELGDMSFGNVKDKDKRTVTPYLTPLNLAYDITPPDIVSAVVTELAVLPCTSVPVILRIKPSESVM